MESLTDRIVPASVVQRFDGVLDIDGSFVSDDVHVFYNRFGDVVVSDRGFLDVFDGATVTGIEFYGYRGNDVVADNYGSDALYGGFGRDTLWADYYDDVYPGGQFGDRVFWE